MAFEPLAGDGVDAAFGRRGYDLVTAFAQNRDALRANQAGATDNDDLHGLPPVDDWRPLSNAKPNFYDLSNPRTSRQCFSFTWVPVIVAVRVNPWLRVYYQRLRASVKRPKVAMIAAMRKLLADV